MKYAAWSVSHCPPPPGDRTSSSPRLTVSLFGTQLSAVTSLVDRLRHLSSRYRTGLLCATAAGAALALGVSGGPRVAGLAVAALAASAAYCSEPMQVVDDFIEAGVADMVGVGECTTIGSTKAEALLNDDTKKLSKSTVEWVMRAKLHFGELKDSAADRICAKRWLAEEMKKADMRDKDACGLIPVVVEMLFIPTSDDVFAAKVRKSRVATLMRHLAGPKPA